MQIASVALSGITLILLASFKTDIKRKTFAAKLLSGGNTWGVLRGKMPEITRAEAMARAELAWELIYKRGTTLKGDNPPKPYLGP